MALATIFSAGGSRRRSLAELISLVQQGQLSPDSLAPAERLELAKFQAKAHGTPQADYASAITRSAFSGQDFQEPQESSPLEGLLDNIYETYQGSALDPDAEINTFDMLGNTARGAARIPGGLVDLASRAGRDVETGVRGLFDPDYATRGSRLAEVLNPQSIIDDYKNRYGTGFNSFLRQAYEDPTPYLGDVGAVLGAPAAARRLGATGSALRQGIRDFADNGGLQAEMGTFRPQAQIRRRAPGTGGPEGGGGGGGPEGPDIGAYNQAIGAVERARGVTGDVDPLLRELDDALHALSDEDLATLAQRALEDSEPWNHPSQQLIDEMREIYSLGGQTNPSDAYVRRRAGDDAFERMKAEARERAVAAQREAFGDVSRQYTRGMFEDLSGGESGPAVEPEPLYYDGSVPSLDPENNLIFDPEMGDWRRPNLGEPVTGVDERAWHLARSETGYHSDVEMDNYNEAIRQIAEERGVDVGNATPWSLEQWLDGQGAEVIEAVEDRTREISLPRYRETNAFYRQGITEQGDLSDRYGNILNYLEDRPRAQFAPEEDLNQVIQGVAGDQALRMEMNPPQQQRFRIPGETDEEFIYRQTQDPTQGGQDINPADLTEDDYLQMAMAMEDMGVHPQIRDQLVKEVYAGRVPPPQTMSQLKARVALMERVARRRQMYGRGYSEVTRAERPNTDPTIGQDPVAEQQRFALREASRSAQEAYEDQRRQQILAAGGPQAEALRTMLDQKKTPASRAEVTAAPPFQRRAMGATEPRLGDYDIGTNYGTESGRHPTYEVLQGKYPEMAENIDYIAQAIADRQGAPATWAQVESALVKPPKWLDDSPRTKKTAAFSERRIARNTDEPLNPLYQKTAESLSRRSQGGIDPREVYRQGTTTGQVAAGRGRKNFPDLYDEAMMKPEIAEAAIGKLHAKLRDPDVPMEEKLAAGELLEAVVSGRSDRYGPIRGGQKPNEALVAGEGPSPDYTPEEVAELGQRFGLSDIEQAALLGRMGVDPRPQESIARELGVKQPAVVKAETRAVAKILKDPDWRKKVQSGRAKQRGGHQTAAGDSRVVPFLRNIDEFADDADTRAQVTARRRTQRDQQAAARAAEKEATSPTALREAIADEIAQRDPDAAEAYRKRTGAVRIDAEDADVSDALMEAYKREYAADNKLTPKKLAKKMGVAEEDVRKWWHDNRDARFAAIKKPGKQSRRRSQQDPTPDTDVADDPLSGYDQTAVQALRGSGMSDERIAEILKPEKVTNTKTTETTEEAPPQVPDETPQGLNVDDVREVYEEGMTVAQVQEALKAKGIERDKAVVKAAVQQIRKGQAKGAGRKPKKTTTKRAESPQRRSQVADASKLGANTLQEFVRAFKKKHGRGPTKSEAKNAGFAVTDWAKRWHK